MGKGREKLPRLHPCLLLVEERRQTRGERKRRGLRKEVVGCRGRGQEKKKEEVEEIGAKRQRGKREGGCCRLGMPGKRSAASSALLLDKLRETVAWINPLLSYLPRCRACHRWVYKWAPVG